MANKGTSYITDPSGIPISAEGGDATRSLAQWVGDRVNVAGFSSLASAVTYAKTNSLDVWVPNGLWDGSDVSQIDYGNVNFYGEGEIEGLYRKHVVRPEVAPSFFSTTSTKNMLANLSSGRDTPTVVLAGDSISTFSANTKTRGGMLTTSIESAFRNQFGDINFYNRAIGGKTFTNLDGNPNNSYPEWYVDESKDWLEYIEELTPDVVVLSMGMNDSSGIKTSSVESIVGKIKAWSNVPDIVFCTNLVPSLDGNQYELYATKSEQEGRDFAAGFVRTYAQYNNHLLLDFNRQCNMARDGFDIVYGALGNGDTVSVVTDTGSDERIVGTKEVYNFKVAIEVDGEALSDDDSFLHIKTGSGDQDYLRVVSRNGYLTFSPRYGSDTVTIQDIVATSEATGAGSFTLHVEKYGNFLTVYKREVNLGANTPAIYSATIVHCGGLFTPRVMSSRNSMLSSVEFSYDQPMRTMPTIRDSELWGVDDTSASVGVWGGSSWNHPSTKVDAHVYRPVLSGVVLNHRGEVSSLSVGLGGVIHTDFSVTSNSAASFGGVQYHIPLSSSSSGGCSFEIPDSGVMKTLSLKYIGDNSAGSTVVLAVYITRFDEGYSPETSLLRAVSVTLDAAQDEVGLFTFGTVTGSPISFQKGDQIDIYRNTQSGDDNYGDLKLLGLNIVSQ